MVKKRALYFLHIFIFNYNRVKVYCSMHMWIYAVFVSEKYRIYIYIYILFYSVTYIWMQIRTSICSSCRLDIFSFVSMTGAITVTKLAWIILYFKKKKRLSYIYQILLNLHVRGISQIIQSNVYQMILYKKLRVYM